MCPFLFRQMPHPLAECQLPIHFSPPPPEASSPCSLRTPSPGEPSGALKALRTHKVPEGLVVIKNTLGCLSPVERADDTNTLVCGWQLHMRPGASSADEVAKGGWIIERNGTRGYMILSNCHAGQCLCAGRPDDSERGHVASPSRRRVCMRPLCTLHEKDMRGLWSIVPMPQHAADGQSVYFYIISDYSGEHLSIDNGCEPWLRSGMPKFDEYGFWEIRAPPRQVLGACRSLISAPQEGVPAPRALRASDRQKNNANNPMGKGAPKSSFITSDLRL